MVIDKLKEKFEEVYCWCNVNKLTINMSKSKLMIFGSKTKLKPLVVPPFKAYGKVLDRVYQYKYLGVTLDPTLNFEIHVKSVIKKIAYKLYTFNQMRTYLTTQIALMVYKSLILTEFDYADIIYDACNVTYCNKLQRLQNHGLRIILCRKSHGLATEELHRSLNISTLHNRRQCHLANFMYKRAANPRHHAQAARDTRQSNKLILLTISPKLERVKHSILYKGSFLWNGLQTEVQRAPTYIQFKLAAKTLFYDNV
jgi:hypothetical protein